jgi:hypothetical protein
MTYRFQTCNSFNEQSVNLRYNFSSKRLLMVFSLVVITENHNLLVTVVTIDFQG